MAVTDYQFLTERGVDKLAEASIRKAIEIFNQRIVRIINEASTDRDLASARAVYTLMQEVNAKINTSGQDITDITNEIRLNAELFENDVNRLDQKIDDLNLLSIATVTGNIATEVIDPNSSILYFQRDNATDTTWELFIYTDDHNWINVGNVDSPTLTGTPTAPTPTTGNNSTQLATTAFVNAEIEADRPYATVAPLTAGTPTTGVSNKVAREDHVHPIDTTRASVASPALTGTPTAPTAATGTNTTQLATTAFVSAEIEADRPYATAAPLRSGTAAVGTSSKVAREDHVHPTDTSRQAVITGAATTIDTENLTPSVVLVSDANGKVAVSAVTATELTYLDGVTSAIQTQLNAKAATTTMNTALAAKAALASPALTGTPTAPTAAAGTNTTQLATTAFVTTAVASKQNTITGAATTIDTENLTVSRALVSDASGKVAVSAVTATELTYLDGVTSAIQTQLNAKAAAGTTNTALASKAALASPAFTGTPTAPTAAAGTNTTQLATTAFVTTAVASKQNTITGAATTIDTENLTASRALVSDANGKVAVSAVTATELTYLDGVTSAIQTQLNSKAATTTMNTALAAKAALASPTFTGSPKAPTAAAGTNTTQLATTAFVTTAVTNVKPKSGTMTLSASSWTASGSNFIQNVSISGLTANHKVDLQPTPAVVTQLITNSCSGLIPSNIDGVCRITAIGAKPTAALSVPYTMTLL